MILDQVEWSDCAVFVLALIPQLLLNVPILQLVQCAVTAIPFIGELIRVLEITVDKER